VARAVLEAVLAVVGILLVIVTFAEPLAVLAVIAGVAVGGGDANVVARAVLEALLGGGADALLGGGADALLVVRLTIATTGL
jgi:hypothetical protein